MTIKYSFLFLALIGLTCGAETTILSDAEDTAIELSKTSYSSMKEQDNQSPDTWETVPISPSEPVVLLSQNHLDQLIHKDHNYITFKDFKAGYKIPYLQAVITLGIIGAFAVSGYYLVKYVYDLLYPQYSPPGFSPVSGGWGSSCAQMNLQGRCECYYNTVPYSPPLDFSAIPNYLSSIQRSCSLSNETLLKINDHFVAAWTEINAGAGKNSYTNSQCQNESFVKDNVWVAHFPAKQGINSRAAHTDLIVSVGSYSADCMARSDPMFGGTIAGWTFACIFTVIFQYCIYYCGVS